jgi:hypothetical protein
MRRSSLLLAFFVGTGSVFLERLPTNVVPVVLAVQDLPAGMAITNGQIAVRLVDEGLVDESRTYGTVEEVVGRIPMERIYGNEVIRADRLARYAMGAGIDALLTPCTVAVGVPSTEATAPETYVDVMRGDRVIAAGVKVLASSDTDAILEVRPAEALVAVGADRVQPHVGPVIDRACARPTAPLARAASPSLGPLYVAPPYEGRRAPRNWSNGPTWPGSSSRPR